MAQHGRIWNRHSGEPIPDDEPVFIFRARDVHAVAALEYYAERCKDPSQANTVFGRATDFRLFARNHPERMKEPDTQGEN